MNKYLIKLIIFLLIFPVLTFAAELRFDTDLNIDNQVISDNFYAAGGNLNLNSVFLKDLTIAGGTVNVSSEVKEDLLIFGGEIKVNNITGGDLKILGGEVEVSGIVNGDLLILGGDVLISDSANIIGETIVVAGQVRYDSAIQNESNILAGSVYINDELSGDSYITTQNIVFGSEANIVGNLKYYAPKKAMELDGANISGVVSFNEINTIRETGVVKSAVLNFLSFWIILKFITTLIIAFGLIYLFKVFTQRVNDIAVKSIFKQFAYGILGLILLTILIIVLFTSLVGLPIGLLLLLFILFTAIIVPAISGIIVGSLVSPFLGIKKKEVNFQSAVVGIILLTILQFIGVLGDITLIFFSFVSWGAILTFLYVKIFKNTLEVKK